MWGREGWLARFEDQRRALMWAGRIRPEQSVSAIIPVVLLPRVTSPLLGSVTDDLPALVLVSELLVSCHIGRREDRGGWSSGLYLVKSYKLSPILLSSLYGN